MPNKAPQWAGVVLLAMAIVSATVLTALGHMTKTELLPLLGGVVVVAHRLLDATIQRRKEIAAAKPEPTDKTPSTIPPPPSVSSGIPVVFGFLGGGMASLLGWI